MLLFHFRRGLRHSILSDMDLTPTNSDDEVQELRETLQSMPSSRKPSKQKGVELQGISDWKY